MSSNRFLAAAASIAFLATLPLAATAQPVEDPHHPAAQAGAQPAAPAPAAVQAGRMMMPMGGNAPNGGPGGMPMMDMANMMQMMMGGQGMMMGGPGMAMLDHVEGRIAFLRTELKINDAQAASWNAFADILRANAKKSGEFRQSMMTKAGGSLAERLDLQERLLAMRLDSTRAFKAAFVTLQSKLSEEQKKTADDLLSPYAGMQMMAMRQMMRSAQRQ